MQHHGAISPVNKQPPGIGTVEQIPDMPQHMTSRNLPRGGACCVLVAVYVCLCMCFGLMFIVGVNAVKRKRPRISSELMLVVVIDVVIVFDIYLIATCLVTATTIAKLLPCLR